MELGPNNQNLLRATGEISQWGQAQFPLKNQNKKFKKKLNKNQTPSENYKLNAIRKKLSTIVSSHQNTHKLKNQ